MKIQYAVVSSVGMIRAVNEDNFYLNGEIKSMPRANCSMKNAIAVNKGLFAVCDGLGGEGYGEQASYLAVKHLKSYQDIFSEKYMYYIEEINNIICKKQEELSTHMGTTLAVLHADKNQIMVLNIGDSRIYQFRDDSLQLLTEDHSEFAAMLKYGVFTEADYYSSPTRNYLTRMIGMKEQEGKPQPYILLNVPWQSKDVFLLCSDGFSGTVLPNEIKGILNEKGSILFKCKKLVKRAIEHGSDDNVTVMLVKVYR